MPAPIHSLLADELNLSDENAEKLLGAMLREVLKRARRQGVRLPELGKFSEENGTLVFEPSDSLARAVNHRFEGLDSEDLASAPDTPSSDEDAESDDGPDTITLGYQESSNWSPIDSEEDATDDGDDEPDTAEFEVPSADDAADTEELQASADDSAQESAEQHSQASKEPPSSPGDSSRTETEELYPLVEDMPGGSEAGDSSDPEPSKSETPDSEPSARRADDNEEYDRERDTLSGIWGSKEGDSEGEEASSSPESESGPDTSSFEDMSPFDEPEETTEEPAATEYVEQDTPSGPEEPSSSAPEPEPRASQPEDAEDPQPEPAAPDEPAEEKSTTLRVLATLLILILVGGGAWYILGQRGMVPRPQTTFAQLKAEVEPHVQDLDVPLVGSSSQSSETTSPPSAQPSASGSGTDPPSDSEPAADTESASAAASASDPGTESTPPAESESSSDRTTPTAAAATTTSGDASQKITASDGGWTIIVASRTQRGPAETLVEDFRERFPDRQLPIDVVPGNVENTTRYRVGVGQFDSREAAQQFLDEFGSQLPDGAWPLRLQ